VLLKEFPQLANKGNMTNFFQEQQEIIQEIKQN
jgi:hypothetical protein